MVQGRLLLICLGHMDANTVLPVNASSLNASDKESSLSCCIRECMEAD